jgi:Domain of unknown function (DUF6460)
LRARGGREHDPEKQNPVFGKVHAHQKAWPRRPAFAKSQTMTEQNSPARHPFEPRPADLAAARRPAPGELERFLGGKPAAVAVRLVFLSLIVGFFLVWLDIRPVDIFHSLQTMVLRFWNMGFQAIHDIAEYVLAGAVIVVPTWLALRLLTMRGKE